MTDPLREALRPVAASVIEDLTTEKQSSVAVGDFAAPPQFDANYGPGISLRLRELLNELKPGIVNASSKYSISGKYDLAEKDGADFKNTSDGNKGPIVLRVFAGLYDSNGQLINSRRQLAEIRDNPTIAESVGISISFPPLAPSSDRNNLIRKAVDSIVLPVDNSSRTPNGYIESGIVRSQPDSPFGVEILATSLASAPQSAAQWSKVSPRQPELQDGLVYVDLNLDEVYALKVYNQSPQDVAVFVEIDGQNIFTFSDIRNESGRPMYSFYTIERAKSGERDQPDHRIIPGWHRTNEKVDSFLVTEYGKGASARSLPSTSRGRTGVITVSFAPATSEEDGTLVAKRGGKVETGFGPPVSLKQEVVKRTVGDVTDIVSIRYSRD